MPRLAAFLRAINVGGTGALPMTQLKAICLALGFENVKTYIASGNVVFDTELDEDYARSLLAAALETHMGKPVSVFIRSSDALSSVLHENPFPNAESNKHLVIFLDKTPSPSITFSAKHHLDELIAVRKKTLHIYYPSGMGKSKLKVPGIESGTARNMNTIKKVVEMMND